MVRAYVYVCAAKKCYNTWLNHPNKGFFCFPRNRELCKTWLHNSGRTDLEVSVVEKSNGYYKLCSDHFEDKYFTDHTRTKLIRAQQPVPTIFVNNITDLLPQGSQTLDIDLPDGSENDDPSTLCECVLDPSQLMVQSERIPISYNSNQVTKKKDYDPDTISKALVNLNPETELHELEDLCRFCMNKAQQVSVDLFSETSEATEIRKTGELLLKHRIDVSDRLPHKVCPQCVTDLETCKRFTDQFRNADRYLRAVAKYSLFIGSENESETDDDTEEISDEELLKPIPKKSLVMPLKSLKPVLEDTQSYLEDNTLGQDKNTESAAGEPVNLETADSELSVNQLLPLQAPEIGLISTDDHLWQNGVELICNNMVILPSQKITYTTPQKSTADKKPPNLTPVKRYNAPLFDLKNLEKDLRLMNSSEYSSQEQLNKGVNIESVGVEPASEYIENELINQLDRNTNDDGNCESAESDTGLTVSYKCLECYSLFSSYPDLVDHVLTNHQKIDKLSGDVNNIEFQNPVLLEEVPKTDHEDSELKCLMCDSSDIFLSKASLIEHMRTSHMWKCTMCNRIFQKEKRLEQHIAAIHDTRTECSVCGKQLKNSQSRRKHERGHDRDCNEICWHCGAILKTKQSLHKHLMLHSGINFPCKICNRPFKTNTHRLRHQAVHRTVPAEKKFLCDACPKRFLHSGSLKAHLLTHSDEKRYKCGDCNKRFRKPQSLKNHERILSLTGECPKNKMWGRLTLKDAGNLSCDICGRKFHKSAGVERHRKFHFCSGNPEIIKKLLDEPEVYSCSVCNRFVFSKIGFQGHMAKHTGDQKPYKCDFCGKTFKYTNPFKVHERLHTGETPFICRFCDRGFRSKLTMRKHESTHSLDKPHMCELCDKTFKSRILLLRHSDVVHKNQRNYQCARCGKLFASRSGLKRHIKKEEHDEKVEEDPVQYMEEYLDTDVDYLDSDNVQEPKSSDCMYKYTVF
ncbi:zinc finger protein 347-like isoform X2 [Homalodisca vitripennis]|uniref:zinc finger protein 347-like isoform X2 n=1 Tax=Homalodisca vitripennis TaxID=197043 RepID=UPI001EEA5278|nr:zinc finger protein 347-like isoform X2 [Homalodisca vitripennis]